MKIMIYGKKNIIDIRGVSKEIKYVLLYKFAGMNSSNVYAYWEFDDVYSIYR